MAHLCKARLHDLDDPRNLRPAGIRRGQRQCLPCYRIRARKQKAAERARARAAAAAAAPPPPRRERPADRSWRAQSACRDIDPDWFFTTTNIVALGAVCLSCPVQQLCLADGLDEPYGYVGGTTVEERREIRRRMKAAKRLPAAA